MPRPELCDEWRCRPLYWSTIAYTRAWWATDGVRLARIKAHGLGPEMLRSLGAEYNVNRSFKRKDKKKGAEDQNAIAVCEILKDECLTWPSDLIGRASSCCNIVRRLREKEIVDDELVSASTKFMWFLRPEGWTMFDRFAAAGMRVPGQLEGRKLSGPDRMRCFYDRLHNAGFSDVVGKMRAVIANSALPDLPPERISDSLFMARGGRGGDASSVWDLKAFLTLLPNSTRQNLNRLAAQLQKDFGACPLASCDRPPAFRKKKVRS